MEESDAFFDVSMLERDACRNAEYLFCTGVEEQWLQNQHLLKTTAPNSQLHCHTWSIPHGKGDASSMCGRLGVLLQCRIFLAETYPINHRQSTICHARFISPSAHSPLAAYFVTTGSCFPSPGGQRHLRLTCVDISRAHESTSMCARRSTVRHVDLSTATSSRADSPCGKGAPSLSTNAELPLHHRTEQKLYTFDRFESLPHERVGRCWSLPVPRFRITDHTKFCSKNATCLSRSALQD